MAQPTNAQPTNQTTALAEVEPIVATPALRLVPYLGKDPFAQYPALTRIWPEPSQELAQEATVEALAAVPPDVFCGVYLAVLKTDRAASGQAVVGMTGFFVTNEQDVVDSDKHVYLRWHGVVPEWRGMRLSGQMLALVVKEIRKYIPEALSLTESIPQTEHAAYLPAHFEELGFVRTGEPYSPDWSPHELQDWNLNLKSAVTTRRFP